VGYLPAVWLASSWVRELRRLVRYRQQQVDERRNAKLRITALIRDHRLKRPDDANPWTRAWWKWLTSPHRMPAQSAWIVEHQRKKIDWLSDEIRDAEQQLWQHTAEDQLTMRLLEERQVGPVTAWVLRAEIDQFDRFHTGKSLARFCALTPRNASSGDRQADAGMVRAGSRLLRATLVELAHRLGRHYKRWREMKDRMKRSGKQTNVITVAVANRWTRQLHHRILTWQQSVQREAGARRTAISCVTDGALDGPLG
jgi:transposase